jgi:hypothetical protein
MDSVEKFKILNDFQKGLEFDYDFVIESNPSGFPLYPINRRLNLYTVWPCFFTLTFNELTELETFYLPMFQRTLKDIRPEKITLYFTEKSGLNYYLPIFLEVLSPVFDGFIGDLVWKDEINRATITFTVSDEIKNDVVLKSCLLIPIMWLKDKALTSLRKNPTIDKMYKDQWTFSYIMYRLLEELPDEVK